MPKLYALATIVLLTLGISGTSLAFRGDFATSDANTMPALLQFDEGHKPAPALGVTHQDHLPPPANPEQAAQTQAQTGERKAEKDDFQEYFERHFRAHLVLNASPHEVGNAQ